MMSDELNFSKETIREIVHEDLRKRRICAKFVLHRLTDEMEAKRQLNASIPLLPGGRAWVGGMVGPRAGQNAVGNRKITAPADFSLFQPVS
jgi:hypothetical protein